MLDKEAARRIAQPLIDELAQKHGRSYVILEDAIEEHPLAWIFTFNSAEYAASGNIMKLVMSLGPVVVKRYSGAACLAPPMMPNEFLESYLADYTPASLPGQPASGVK